MKYNCKVIQDLLPLYTDGICSDVSAQIVEEHLKECASCEKIAKELQDDSVEKTLGKECDHVVLSHEKKSKQKDGHGGEYYSSSPFDPGHCLSDL